MRILQGSIYGILFSCLAFFLITKYSDINLIAVTIGAGLIILLIYTFASVSLTYFKLKELKVHFTPEQDNYHSKTSGRFTLSLVNLALLPFVQLEIKFIFKHSDFNLQTKIIRVRKDIHLPIQATFPHYGNWETVKVLVCISDILNLWSFARTFPLFQSLKILPSVIAYREQALILSGTVSGDQITSEETPRGDYYDLKPYHPSDGANKIVWKIFARTGELVSRHPEPSASPDGEVLIYCLSNKKTDRVAASVLSYLLQLQKHNLAFQLACKGGNKIAKNFDEAKELLLDAVWQAEEQSNLDLLLDKKNIQNIVLFAGENDLDIHAISDYLLSKNIKPHFFLEKEALKKTDSLLKSFFFVRKDDQNPNLFPALT